MVSRNINNRHVEHINTIMLRLVRIHIDKSATLDGNGGIHYTHFRTGKSGVMDYYEQERVYRDLYGETKERWSVDHKHLVFNTELKKEARKRGLSHAYLRRQYANSGNWDI